VYFMVYLSYMFCLWSVRYIVAILNIYFKFVTAVSYFLGHDKLRLIRLVYQVYLYGFFSIAHKDVNDEENI
jgi:hypothetical protein